MEEFIYQSRGNISYGSFSLLTEAGFINGCSCRGGGESDVIEGTLNLALHVQDASEKVLANRRAFAEALGVAYEKFTTCEQVHGCNIVQVGHEHIGRGALAYGDTLKGADALFTILPHVPLLLFYADCVPVILADQATGAIGLAHAGWRGTVGRIALKTVRAMQEALGTKPENILAAIGPSIGACCYEVDDAVRILAAGYEKFFQPAPDNEGKYMLDLWGYNRELLLKAGLLEKNIIVAAVCTSHNSDKFFSYRAESGKTGRMGVCIQSNLCK
ncbi:MAG: peptidoglycan editing factor PgeF [Acidaminococcaceae bacterium]|nr:peptidoglycan editing factor PgeF [Acidaminococcaceae bacterium]